MRTIILSLLLILLWNISATHSQEKGADVLKWKQPQFNEKRIERTKMVSTQLERGFTSIKDEQTLRAMRNVPRHLFVPKRLQSAAYDDTPLPIGNGQTISQPFIVAYMTEQLKLSSGEKILEIGTGSGYQAAILSEITPNVYSIEIIKELGEMAKSRLINLGYATIKVKIDDGYYGWKKYAPFDAIIVTCASGHVPPPLIDQLKPGGRIIVPIGGVYEVQMLILITKDSKGNLKTEQLIPVRFVPMTGKIQN